MRCRKSLYGLPSASYYWATDLSGTMTKLGFTRMDGDKCAWTRGTGHDIVKVGTHVDDLLCVGKPGLLKHFGEQFAEEYECNSTNRHATFIPWIRYSTRACNVQSISRTIRLS